MSKQSGWTGTLATNKANFISSRVGLKQHRSLQQRQKQLYQQTQQQLQPQTWKTGEIY